MKIDNLNFAELHKLSSTANICALTAKYHTDLRAEWDLTHRGGFMVSTAEKEFPGIVAQHRPTIDFLNGPEVKARLRELADRTSIYPHSGQRHVVRVCEWFTPGQRKAAEGLAGLCRYFLDQSGIRASFNIIDGAIQVRADVTRQGVIVLLHRSGFTIREFQNFSHSWKLPFDEIFWWLRLVTPVPTGDKRINPLLRCLNTPDVVAHANSLVN